MDFVTIIFDTRVYTPPPPADTPPKRETQVKSHNPLKLKGGFWNNCRDLTLLPFTEIKDQYNSNVHQLKKTALPVRIGLYYTYDLSLVKVYMRTFALLVF